MNSNMPNSLLYIYFKYLSVYFHMVCVMQTSCRAASVLSHVMKDNIQCKEKVRGLMLLIYLAAYK